MKGILIGEVLFYFLGSISVMASAPSDLEQPRKKGKSICMLEKPAGNSNFVFYFSPSGSFLNAWEKLDPESQIVMDHAGLGFDVPEENPDLEEVRMDELELKCDVYCDFCNSLSNAIENQNLAEIKDLVKSDENIEFLKKSPGVVQWIVRQLYERLKKDHGRSQNFVLQVSSMFDRRNTKVDFYLKRLLSR